METQALRPVEEFKMNLLMMKNVNGLIWTSLYQRTTNTKTSVKLQNKMTSLGFLIATNIKDMLSNRLHAGAVVSAFVSQWEGPCSDPRWDLSVWSWHVLLVDACVFSRHSSFFPVGLIVCPGRSPATPWPRQGCSGFRRKNPIHYYCL